jgi:hypothetical protein
MDDLPHNPFKLPLYLLGVVMGAAFVIRGLSEGPGWLVAAGVVALGLCAVGLQAILRGRNPWYTRSPLDRRFARKRHDQGA